MIKLYNPLQDKVGKFANFYKDRIIGEGTFNIIYDTLHITWTAAHTPLSTFEVRELKRDFDLIIPRLKEMEITQVIAIDPLVEGTFEEFVTLLRFHRILGYTNTYMLFRKEV